MPNWDLVATLKFVARYAIILGMFLFIAGFASVLGNAILSLWALVNNGVDDFQRLFNGSGTGSSSCFFYYFHELGLDVAVTSFFVGFVGLGTAWSGAVVSILGYRTAIYGKTLLLESLK